LTLQSCELVAEQVILMRKTVGRALVVLGLVAVSAAAVVHWVLVPRLAQLPGDTNTTRVYTGQAAIVANPTIVTGVRIGPGLLRNVPVEVQHNTSVIATRGHQALVSDKRVLTTPGYTLATLANRFDVDRRTFLPGRTFSSATPARGLTFNWSMGTKPQDYTGWVSDTQQTTPLQYSGAVRHAGVDTYVFRAQTAFAPITDAQILRILPASMTQRQLMEITPSLLFSRHHLLKLDRILSTAPQTVPLAYDYKVNSTFWVAPASGMVVDHQQREVRFLSLVVHGRHVPIAPVMDMSYRFTPATVVAAATDAKDSAAQLTLLRQTLPIGLLVGGLAALLVAVGLLLSHRRFQSPLGDEELAEVLLWGDERVPTRL
jgi:hypothetical protein